MNKFFVATLTTGLLLVGGIAFAQDQATEQAPQPQGPHITFPIPELGNCGSKQECKTYCDAPDNAAACINFAESKGMMKADEAAQARKFATQTGPGGCRGSECRTYCNDKAHFAECQKFAQDNGIPMPKGPPQGPRGPRVDEGKAEMILAQKAGPGGCTTKDQCRAYCDDPDHSTECVKFAEDNGLMTKEDAQLARKLMSEAGPGGCRGEKACSEYCNDDSHMQECLSFAEKNGLMDPQELQQAKNFIEKGGPGGCKGRQACDQFCQSPSNAETCIDFAVQNGMMSADDAAKVKEMMKGGGPGGPPGHEGQDKGFGGFFGDPDQQGRPDGGHGGLPCKNPEECKAFCENNPQACEGGPDNAHPMYRLDRGGPGPTIGPSSREEQDNFGPKQTGPGGCTSQAECESYCQAHPQECGAPAPGMHMEGPPSSPPTSFLSNDRFTAAVLAIFQQLLGR